MIIIFVIRDARRNMQPADNGQSYRSDDVSSFETDNPKGKNQTKIWMYIQCVNSTLRILNEG